MAPKKTDGARQKAPISSGSGPSEPIQPPESIASSDSDEVQHHLKELNDRLFEQNERIAAQFEQLLIRLTPSDPSNSDTTLLTPKEPSRNPSPAPTPLVKYKLPPVPLVTKLKGRENYKTWVFNITRHARTYGV
jgi:hypothetical protein